MRFREFKLFEQDQKAGFYTVGDSHAVGLANYAGKPWISKAKNGTRSTDPIHNSAIASIPKGSTVAISLGANDAQNIKTDPKTIATSVSNVISAAAQRGLKVHFVLFPIGTQPNAEFRAKVRDAIKSAVDVPIVDLEGSKLVDGVHADASAYKKAAQSIISSSPLGAPSGAPGAPTTKDKQGQGASPTALVLDVPTGRKGPAVRDVQQALMALGYALPKHGADGIRGPETKIAVSKFQTDNNLTVDGDPGPETVGKLNDILKSKPEVASKITKSTSANVKADYAKGAADVDALASDDSVKEAKLSAEKFLGRVIDDKEWNYLVRATSAEASNNSAEQANVMGVILNRARSGKWGDNIISVLRAPNQFQAVTGTRMDPNPSSNFTRGPSKLQLANIVQGTIKILPTVSKDVMNFTSNVDAAYGAGTNIGFKSKLAAAPNSYVVGQTVFGTA
jgi:peptidoglycan hydrolase-like protein with peptidoglycan-binding domain